jgi:D-alanine-D-alanine ligase
VVKPAADGSSVGITIAQDRASLATGMAEALKLGEHGMAEAFCSGKELTVGVLGDRALPTVWIRPGHAFYDYEAKYGDAGTQYVCPAPLDPDLAARVQSVGLEAFRALGCRHYARTDVMLDEEGSPSVLEVNTIPGFTPTSLLPKAARAVGISFPDLCDRIARMAIED